MKLHEVLEMGGASQFVHPSTFIKTQVVQPITHQTNEPEQTDFNKAARKKKEQERIDWTEYNKKSEEQLKNYFDNIQDADYADEKLAIMVKKLEKNQELNKKSDYQKYTKKLNKTI